MSVWQGREIEVTAHLVPKFLFFTASIDVFAGRQRILSTGGSLKILDRHREQFTLPDGSFHEAELIWSPAGKSRFSYTLLIDGAPVESSKVRISNLWVGSLMGTVIILGVLAYYILHVFVPVPESSSLP